MSISASDYSNPKKVALVTGGSYGLGFAMACHLVAVGYKVVILARDDAKLRGAVQKLSKAGGEVVGIACDITNVEALHDAAISIQERYRELDFVVANAGSVHPGLLEDLDPESAVADIETGLIGAVLTARAFLPFLRSGSKVLFIASGFGLMGAAGYASYCAANAGIINFADALRRELLIRNIAVYVACPSDIDTPGFRRELEDLPPWMKKADARGEVMSADEAAKRILTRCHGRRFLIVINREIQMLQLMKRLMPERALQFLVDRLFPKPS